MSRIQQTFAALKAQNKTALIPYVTAGDPHPDMAVKLMHRLVAEGADMIEMGVPFSDPMADGPVIQKAVERALKHNVSLSDVLGFVKEFRLTNQHTPVALMGYLNPIEAKGFTNFAKEAKQAGLDGVLTVDMPPEETAGYLETLREHELDRIFLVSPTTPDSRLAAVNEKGSGFVYYVSLKGVTGSKTLDEGDVRQHVEHLKSKTSLPVGIGFGISTGETAYSMAKIGDAIIVGSALVRLIEQQPDAPFDTILDLIGHKMQEFRAAIVRADQETQA